MAAGQTPAPFALDRYLGLKRFALDTSPGLLKDLASTKGTRRKTHEHGFLCEGDVRVRRLPDSHSVQGHR